MEKGQRKYRKGKLETHITQMPIPGAIVAIVHIRDSTKRLCFPIGRVGALGLTRRTVRRGEIGVYAP